MQTRDVIEALSKMPETAEVVVESADRDRFKLLGDVRYGNFDGKSRVVIDVDFTNDEVKEELALFKKNVETCESFLEEVTQVFSPERESEPDDDTLIERIEHYLRNR